jgi:glycogen(starch) synthase
MYTPSCLAPETAVRRDPLGSPQMRVLVFSWEYPPVIEGGLARHVRKLSERLVAQGVEVHVLTREVPGGSAATEHRQGVVVHRVAQPGFPRELDAFLRWVTRLNTTMTTRARTLTAAHEFDLVHSHDWLVADAARATARRIARPWLVTVHATEHGRHQGWVTTHPQSTIHAAERAMVHQADHVITCSRYMRGHVTEVFGITPGRVTALRNGIDPADLQPVAEDLPALRARFAAPEQRLVLLVGRLVHEKGFHLALEALAPLTRARGDVRFVVAGTGTAEQELRRRSRSLALERYGRFLGWVDDDTLHSLYRVGDLCVVPSLYEPFGIVALEAMASGCPCIVADTGGLREVVPAGETVGLRVSAGDPQALGTALARMLGDDALRARLSTAAREHVLRYDWSRVAEATRAVYARLLAGALARA